MLWYLSALACYCLGYASYAGAAAIGLPGVVARILGVAVGVTPLAVLVVRRRRARAAQPRVAPPVVAPPPAWSANVSFAELQQRPIPCACCGAPMAPIELAGMIERAQCPYCRRIDDVPRDAAIRIEFLRARVAELRAARQELTGIDHRVAQVIEDGTWLRGTLLAALGPTSIIVFLLVLPGLYVGGARGMLVGLGMLAQLGGIVLGMALTYRALARRYLRVVRPRILARAPERPGAPARCRVCGGPVEVRGSAFVTCGFCGSANLVARELARECRRFLDAEIAEYRYRASTANRDVADHHRLVARGLVLGNVLGSIAGSAAFSAIIALIWWATG